MNCIVGQVSTVLAPLRDSEAVGGGNLQVYSDMCALRLAHQLMYDDSPCVTAWKRSSDQLGLFLRVLRSSSGVMLCGVGPTA